MGRTASFGADPESSSVLKSLGYSEEEISGTPGEASPDDLRTSLRQLSAAHSSDVERKASASAPAPNPKFQNAVDTPDNDDYWQGRKDEALQRKENMNPGGKGNPNPGRGRAQTNPNRQANQTMKQLGRIMKTFGSGGGSASKALGGVTRAQRGRRR